MGNLNSPLGRAPDSRDAAVSEGGGVTFQVADVTPALKPLPETDYQRAVENLIGAPRKDGSPNSPLEACSSYHGRLVDGTGGHPFVGAVYLAFDQHRPLRLSPDAIWLLIAQGLANHVNANAEQLRHRFVQHSGKFDLNVERHDFVKGSPENPWAEVVAEFSAAIRGHIGESTHDLLVPHFSTTGPAERAACEIVLMDAMQAYFSYGMMTMCGIPSITLTGNVADWTDLVDRARRLAEFDLDWWIRSLIPVLEQFVTAARGLADREFWQSFYKLDGGSGGPYVNGWINTFFPYLKDEQTGLPTSKNSELESDRCRLTFGCFPRGLAKAPVSWNYNGKTQPLEFLGGFVGIRQDPQSLCLTPEIGWAIRNAEPYAHLTWPELIETCGKPTLGNCLARSELRQALNEGRLFSMHAQGARNVLDEEEVAGHRSDRLLAFPTPLPAELRVRIDSDNSFRNTDQISNLHTPAKGREMLANYELLRAAAEGRVAGVEQALNNTADVNVRRSVKAYQVWWGHVHEEGALDLAALSGSRETVAFLLSQGIVLRNPIGTFAWMCAACNGHEELADDLERAGVVVEIKDWQKQRLNRIRARGRDTRSSYP